MNPIIEITVEFVAKLDLWGVLFYQAVPAKQPLPRPYRRSEELVAAVVRDYVTGGGPCCDAVLS
jgi:hypothetical protein